MIIKLIIFSIVLWLDRLFLNILILPTFFILIQGQYNNENYIVFLGLKVCIDLKFSINYDINLIL